MITKETQIIGSGENRSQPESIMPTFYPISIKSPKDSTIPCLLCKEGHYSLRRVAASMKRDNIEEKSGKVRCSHCREWMYYNLSLLPTL